MELMKFQNFYTQLVSKIEEELSIDKEKLSMILHSQIIEHTVEYLLNQIKENYKASQIELWFLDPTYNRYYLFDASISIRHVFRSMTRSLSAFHFDTFFDANIDYYSDDIVNVKSLNTFIFSQTSKSESIYAIPLDHQKKGVVIIFNPKKHTKNTEIIHLVKQNISLINSLLYTDDFDYTPHLVLEPLININALLGIEKLCDPLTHIHEAKVAALARMIAFTMKFPSYTVEKIAIAGKLHDLGKLLISNDLFLKGDQLTEDEIKYIKTHVTMSSDILSLLGFSKEITKLVIEHHERLDGSGYPQGLKGNQIHLESQIIAIADELVVIGSNDAYHERISKAESIFEMVQFKGVKYSAILIETVEQMIRDKILLPLIK